MKTPKKQKIQEIVEQKVAAWKRDAGAMACMIYDMPPHIYDAHIRGFETEAIAELNTTYKHEATGKRFRIGSEILWEVEMSAAGATWEVTIQGEILEVDYQSRTLTVQGEAETREYYVESHSIKDVLIF